MKVTLLLLSALFGSLLSVDLYGQNFTILDKTVASDREENDYFGSAVAISGNYAVVGAHLKNETTLGLIFGADAGAAYVFEKNTSGTWIEVQKLTASDYAVNDQFGSSVAISGDYILVGAKFQDEDENGLNVMSNSGAVYVFERNASGVWVEVQKLVASDRAPEDLFSWSLDISGDRAIVGAYYEDEDENNSNSMMWAGSAYIFERNSSGVWNEVQKIVASDRDVMDQFGWSVAISNDYAAVGANWEDHDENGLNIVGSAGSVYIFERNGSGAWNQVQKVVAPVRFTQDEFGCSVSLSGNLLAVGAPFENEDESEANFLSDAGAAYILERNGVGTWNHIQKIVPSDRETDDIFGFVLDISGNKLLVGAPYEDHDGLGTNYMTQAGAAYLFEDPGTGVWSQLTKAIAVDRTQDDQFGRSLSISDSNLIVGAPFEQHNLLGMDTLDNAGAVYIDGICASVTSSITESACGSYTSPAGNTYTSSGIYLDTISSSLGCDSIVTIDLTVNNIPALDLGNDTVFCQGPSILLDAGNSGAVFLWNDGSTGQELNVNSSGVYSVTVTNAANCSASDSISVLVNELPSINAGLDPIICLGDTAILNVTGGLSYVWVPTGDTVNSINVSPSTGTWYSVTGTDANDCSATDSVYLDVITLGSVAANWDSTTVENPGIVSINVAINDTGSVATITILDPPLNGTAQNVGMGFFEYFANADFTGTDSLTYLICDPNCSNFCDTTTVYFYVVEAVKDELLIPSGFTPNGDGINDELVILGLSEYPNNELLIFNRWGNQIFSAKPYENNWVGQSNAGLTFGGNEVVDGTYFYVLYLDSDIEPLNGSIELKRQ